MRVLITTSDYDSYRLHFDALCPSGEHRWGDVVFHYVPDGKPYDAWVVWQSIRGLPEVMSVECPPERTLLVLREPPDIVTLPLAYVRQFGGVLGPDRQYHHPTTFYEQFGQVWHVERDLEFLRDVEAPEKTGWISAVTSNKSGTPGQRLRLDLLLGLKKHFKDKLVHFGRGFNEVASKWDAIHPYRYHLTLENGEWPHYWSEKLSDAYLGWSMPLYVGCPQLSEYFSKDSCRTLDPKDLRGCIETVESAIEGELYERSIPAIGAARQKILDYYHFYPTLIRCLDQMASSKLEEVSLKPSSQFEFSFGQRMSMRLRNARRRLLD